VADFVNFPVEKCSVPLGYSPEQKVKNTIWFKNHALRGCGFQFQNYEYCTVLKIMMGGGNSLQILLLLKMGQSPLVKTKQFVA
jgi:hypothetical protein